jgi:hypothetical protein
VVNIASNKTDDGWTLVVGFDAEKLQEVFGGGSVHFRMKQFGVTGILAEKRFIILLDNDKMEQWRNNGGMVPKDIARVDCLQRSTMQRIIDGESVRLPRDRNKVETVIVGTDNKTELERLAVQ